MRFAARWAYSPYRLRPVRISLLVRPVLALLLVLGASPLVAQTPALGPEFQVNTYTTDHQSHPSTAMAADGCIIVAWDSVGEDGSQLGVVARVYDPLGVPKTAAISRSTHTPRDSSSSRPSPAARTATSSSPGRATRTGPRTASSGSGSTKTETRSGRRVCGEHIHHELAGDSSAAMDSAGNFVIVWMSFAGDGAGFGISGQRFNTAGAPLGGEFVVNTTTADNQMYPSVAMALGGEFVVAWQSLDQDGDQEGIFARRYDSSGNPLSSEIPVNTYTTDRQIRASVDIEASGGFVVAWQSEGQDGERVGSLRATFRRSRGPDHGRARAERVHNRGPEEPPRRSHRRWRLPRRLGRRGARRLDEPDLGPPVRRGLDGPRRCVPRQRVRHVEQPDETGGRVRPPRGLRHRLAESRAGRRQLRDLRPAGRLSRRRVGRDRRAGPRFRLVQHQRSARDGRDRLGRSLLAQRGSGENLPPAGDRDRDFSGPAGPVYTINDASAATDRSPPARRGTASRRPAIATRSASPAPGPSPTGTPLSWKTCRPRGCRRPGRCTSARAFPTFRSTISSTNSSRRSSTDASRRAASAEATAPGTPPCGNRWRSSC